MGNPDKAPVKGGLNATAVMALVTVVGGLSLIAGSFLPPPQRLGAHEPPRAVKLPHDSVSLTVKQGAEVVFSAHEVRNFAIAPGERCRILGWNSKNGHEELIVPDGLLIHIRSYTRAEQE